MIEVEVRAMLENATGFEPNIVEGRFMIHTLRLQNPWVVIVEPDAMPSCSSSLPYTRCPNDGTLASSHLP
ncbi:MAG: hypothetical protein LC804_25300, partial [Acidobacteria bacterium]|nr:hypothetical protein [Acidobacteriota bacterium]